jgi:ketosteroid isomerase-like protein
LCSLLLACGAFGSAVPLFAQGQPDSVAIIQLLKDDYKTLPSRDAKGHLANCTADFMLIEKGEFMTMQREIEVMYAPHTGAPIIRSDTFEVRRVTVLGDVAYAAYSLASNIQRGDKRRVMHWNESAFFRREAGRWKIAMVHSTPVEAAPK